MTPDRHAVEAFAAACARDEQNVLVRRGNAVEAAIRCATGRPDMVFDGVCEAVVAGLHLYGARRGDAIAASVPWIWRASEMDPDYYVPGRQFVVVVDARGQNASMREVFGVLGLADVAHTFVDRIGDMSVFVRGEWDEEDEA